VRKKEISMANIVEQYIEIAKQTETVMDEIIEATGIKAGQIFVVGCSSSEIVGSRIGKGSSFEAARAVFEVICKKLEEKGIIINDLYSITKGFDSSLHADWVHFNEEGSQILAEAISKKILSILE
jgi:lysophospholipase L1-like esterase